MLIDSCISQFKIELLRYVNLKHKLCVDLQ